jgi:sulfate adenylyltransferase subunit 2
VTVAETKPATTKRVDELRLLEAEAVHIIREVVAEIERPVLVFSAGKDFIVLLALAEKAFRPLALPFPVMHVDAGHNFPEVIDFRDRRLHRGARRHITGRMRKAPPQRPLQACAQRRAQRPHGLDAPYEPPEDAYLVLDTADANTEDLAAQVIALLDERSPRRQSSAIELSG